MTGGTEQIENSLIGQDMKRCTEILLGKQQLSDREVYRGEFITNYVWGQCTGVGWGVSTRLPQ